MWHLDALLRHVFRDRPAERIERRAAARQEPPVAPKQTAAKQGVSTMVSPKQTAAQQRPGRSGFTAAAA